MHRQFEDLHVVAGLIAEVSEEGGLAAGDHVEVEVRDGIKAAAFEEDGLFVKHIAGLPDFAVGTKQGGVGEAETHELQRHEAVLIVHRGKGGAGEVDHVDLHAFPRETIE